jgi:hypothetical protein
MGAEININRRSDWQSFRLTRLRLRRGKHSPAVTMFSGEIQCLWLSNPECRAQALGWVLTREHRSLCGQQPSLR